MRALVSGIVGNDVRKPVTELLLTGTSFADASLSTTILQNILSARKGDVSCRDQVSDAISHVLGTFQAEAAIGELRKILDTRLADFGEQSAWYKTYGFPEYMKPALATADMHVSDSLPF